MGLPDGRYTKIVKLPLAAPRLDGGAVLSKLGKYETRREQGRDEMFFWGG